MLADAGLAGGCARVGKKRVDLAGTMTNADLGALCPLALLFGERPNGRRSS
jgi:hypothetical protein